MSWLPWLPQNRHLDSVCVPRGWWLYRTVFFKNIVLLEIKGSQGKLVIKTPASKG
jgi:hypothetical protein